MLEDQVISVSFSQGVDTKTDSKQIAVGKLSLLENGEFTSPKKISKMPGYDSLPLTISNGGGSISSPVMTASFKNELILCDGTSLYGYSPTISAWSNKGYYTSMEVKNSIVSSSQLNQQHQCMASTGTVLVMAWSETAYVKHSVIDQSTGTKIVSDSLLVDASGAAAQVLHCVKLSASKVGVFYINGSNSLALKIVTISGTSITLGAEIVIEAVIPSTWGALGFVTFAVSASETSTGAVIGYVVSYGVTTSAVRIKTIDNTGAVTHTANTTASGWAVDVCTYSDSNGKVWAAWFNANTTTNETGEYITFNSDLSAYGSLTTFASRVVYGTNIAILSGFSGYGSTAILYSDSSSAALGIGRTRLVTVSAAGGGVGAISTFMAGSYLFSRPFDLNGKTYVVLQYLKNDGTKAQSVLFLVNCSTKQIDAKALYGRVSESRTYWPLTSVSVGGLKAYLPSIYDVTGPSFFPFKTNSSCYVTFDASADGIYQAVESNNVLALNGGYLRGYDGRAVTELGFHVFPEIMQINTSTTGGLMADATYTYYAIFRWVDANGNIFDSAPSYAGTATISGGGGSGSTILSIQPLYATMKTGAASDVTIRVYRSSTLAPGSQKFVAAVANTPGVDSPLTVYDTFSDTQIASMEILYTSGGVLENSPAPPAIAIASHGTRFWCVDSENPSSAWYSKSNVVSGGIAMSALLTANSDTTVGNISVLASLDEKLIILREGNLSYVVGEGANDTGTGSTLSISQPLPASMGVSDRKSVVVLPNGVMFKSGKGYHLLDRASNISYIGAEVEAFNSQTISHALVHPTKTQVRFLTASGTALIYDYLMNQWGNRTNHLGYSATNWNGVYTYVRTDGRVFTENKSKYLDGSSSYALKAKLSPITFAGIQGFQRVRRFALLGGYANGLSASHSIQVSAAYDSSSSLSTPVQYAFSASASISGTFQFRERLPIQKCNSLTLYIEEVVTGDSSEYVDLSALSLEVGVKKGIRKMPATQSVG